MRSIGVKLAIAFLSVAVVAAALTAVSLHQVTAGRFNAYRMGMSARQLESLQGLLGSFYAATGSWRGVDELLRSTYGPGPGAGTAPGRGPGPGFGAGRMMGGRPADGAGISGLMGMGPIPMQVLDASGTVVASTFGPLGGKAEASGGVPLEVGGQRVGTLLVVTPGLGPDSPLEAAFTAGVSRAAVWGGLVAAALAVLLGVYLARRITGPVSALAAATRAVARRDLSARVPAAMAGSDEIGQLAADFNQMADHLVEQERLRRTLIADVAHELRTPVAVLRSQFEAIQDGVADPTPEALLPMHDEVLRLSRLLDDLQALALADAGQLPLHQRPIRPADLVNAAAGTFAPAAIASGAAFTATAAAELPLVAADADRVKQVLLNLLGNALRHTPPGGRIQLTAESTDGAAVRFTVADTGDGIAAADLPHVFDRFWRAEKSRSRAGGGAGLGLAIARGIVLAHGGDIAVASAPGQGSQFRFTLPLATVAE